MSQRTELEAEILREQTRLADLQTGKSEVRIYDYVDRCVPMLVKMFERRLRGYRAIGYARDEAPTTITREAPQTTIDYDGWRRENPDRNQDHG